MQRSIMEGVGAVLSTKVITLIVGVISTPILYRLLGPSAFGVYAFLLSVFSLLMIFVSSGVTEGVRKFLAEDRDQPDWERDVVGFYLRLALLLGLVGAGLVFLVTRTGVVARFFGPEFTPYFYLLAILVLVAQFRAVNRRTLMGFGLERYSEPLKAGNRVAFVLIALPLVYVGYGVTGAIFGLIVANGLAVIVSLYLIHRRVPLVRALRSAPDSLPRRSLLSFNTLSVLLILLMMSLYHVDILLIQWFTGSTQVGHYKAALKIAEFLWFVPLAIQMVFVHSMSNLWSNDRTEKVTAITADSTRYTLLLTALLALGLAGLAEVAVPLYFGPKSTPAIEPLLLLLPGALGFAVARPILAVSQGKGDLGYPIAATGIAAGLNLGLNLLLIPRYGMHGAAVATSIGYGSMFVLHVWAARKLEFDPLADARLFRVAVTTVLAAIPILGLPMLIQNQWLALLIVPPVGLIVYGGLAFATGALDVDEVFDILCSTPLAPYVESLEHRVAADGGITNE